MPTSQLKKPSCRLKLTFNWFASAGPTIVGRVIIVTHIQASGLNPPRRKMRLSLVFELLLIFVLLAFAASAVIDSKGLREGRADAARKRVKGDKNRQNTPNRYCSCSKKLCNCCRDFNIPVLAIQGPGCASLQYLKGDRLAISMSFGERILSNTTISSKKPKPVCMPLPGGISRFCGRVYNIRRSGEDFNACLGLELRSLKNVEASVRVACFRFGVQGLRVEPAQPLPIIADEGDDNDDEDDEDDDDDDDDDEEYEFDDDDDDDADNDVDTADYGTFSVFDEDLLDDFFVSDSDERPSKKPAATTTQAPVRKISRKPIRNPIKNPLVNRPNRRRPSTQKPALAFGSNLNKNKITVAPPTTTTTTKTTTTSEAAVVTDANKVVESIKIPDEKISSELKLPPSTYQPIVLVTRKPATPAPAPPPEPTTQPPTPAPTPTRSDFQGYTETTLSTQATPETSPAFVTEPQEPPEKQATTLKTAAAPEQETKQPPPSTTETVTSTTEEVEDETDNATETSYIISNDDDNEEEDEESDPITDAMEEIIEDEVGKETPAPPDEGEKKPEKENKDIVDDIVDGVVDTIVGEEDETTTKAGEDGNNADDDDDEEIEDVIDDDDDDDDDENEEEDEESRKLKRSRRRSKARHSRDMWLDRLHW